MPWALAWTMHLVMSPGVFQRMRAATFPER